MPPKSSALTRGPAHRARTHGLPGAHAAVAPRRGSARDVVIAVLGVVGILTVAWLAASAVLSLSIVVFVTGSMSPSMPTGTAAVVQEVPANALAVGDVVTVPKPNSSTPVTHRIVEISPVEGDPASRSLVLRGDANSIDDLDPYVVEDARRVVVAAPGVGWLVIAAKTPLAMVAISIVVAAGIVWALWPGEPRAADSVS